MNMEEILNKISDEAKRSASSFGIKIDSIEIMPDNEHRGYVEIKISDDSELRINYFRKEHELFFDVKKGEPLYQFAEGIGNHLAVRGDFFPPYKSE